MEYIKIKKVIEEITRAKEQNEIKRAKNAIKLNFNCWGDYTETTDKNGEQYRINKKLTPTQQQKPLKEQKEILIKNINKRYENILNNLNLKTITAHETKYTDYFYFEYTPKKKRGAK